MNDRIKTWIYIICSILVIGIVGYLALNLLIFLIPVLIVIFIIFKIKGYIDGKKRTKSANNSTYQYKSYNDNKVESIDNSNSEVIDVDYEDVDK
ncbi:hypothetical protein R0131_15875 [Clostridium sp. AL.422]|uniref:hypothetical protein n=1 Tax=Clostridium TaxID=1485 RepID=UPI00293DE2E2|nr:MULTISPECIES: hypothetical protein [unclassified Clostridium]MDV4152304.1 hypothetical protein [Clostridium sp. AL.422]